jgi:hypothetical protein
MLVLLARLPDPFITSFSKEGQANLAEVSDNDLHQAQRYVERLLSEREDFWDELPEGFSLADVQKDSDQFSFELEVASSVGEGLPVAHTQVGPIPVSFLQFGHGQIGTETLRRGYRPPYWYDLRDWYYFAVRHSRDVAGAELKFEFVSPSTARESFISRATDFLATRLAWIRDWGDRHQDKQPSGGSDSSWNLLYIPPNRGRPPTGVPGCNFLVYTNTPNLSVYWSGAYYLSPNYFGHPTSPAGGPLQAGTYVFGVNGGAYGQAVRWDVHSVCSLPGPPSVHLNY